MYRQSNLCFIVNIFSASRIALNSRLSPSDWAHLHSILKKARTEQLNLKTEVDWKELENVLIELPEITRLGLSDFHWSKITDMLSNVNNKELELLLLGEVKFDSETGDHIKRLTLLCKEVWVDTLRLSEGKCVAVDISSNRIEMYELYLHSGEDVTRLHQLVSQYELWEVEYGGQYLNQLGSDDWALFNKYFKNVNFDFDWDHDYSD